MAKYLAKKPDDKGFIDFTPEENETWKILIQRQTQIVKSHACEEYLTGLQKLALPTDHIPQCSELSETLNSLTGWSVVPVEAMISVQAFFKLLSERKFPAASFIRLREELDYLQEPDIFHEFFGHCPLLTHQIYADFLQQYGEIALQASKEAYSLLGRLFWFTIEFGLINTLNGVRIYGGGILSSYQETVYALENSLPQKQAFDITAILNTPYRYDLIQDKYYIINSFQDLFQVNMPNVLLLAEKLAHRKPTAQNKDFLTC